MSRSSHLRLLLYCQHSLGLGHLVRSLALADGLADHFEVVLACGGSLPDGLRPPERVRLVALPALGAGLDGEILSHADRPLRDARRRRRELLLETLRSARPHVLVLELFPFGRRKFADELVPLLDEAHGSRRRPLIVSSLRDILVGRDSYQEAHDTLSCVLANKYFDAVLVHSDPRFARLDESFCPAVPLRTPVYHTGFVVAREWEAAPGTGPHVVVSAGGGLVGEPLLRAAVEARAHLPDGVALKVVAGPFLPEEAWRALEAAAGRDGVELHRFVPDLAGELPAARASVSQCGYNTALDVLRAGVPALVVPFAEGREDEQTRRARRLEQLGAVRVLDPERLDATTLAAEIRRLLRFRPAPVALDLDGAQRSARLLARLARGDVEAAIA